MGGSEEVERREQGEEWRPEVQIGATGACMRMHPSRSGESVGNVTLDTPRRLSESISIGIERFRTPNSDLGHRSAPNAEKDSGNRAVIAIDTEYWVFVEQRKDTRNCDFARMNKDTIQPLTTVIDTLNSVSTDHVDSTRLRQEELDRTLASMLQEVEDRRADQLQIMVAETLSEEKGGEGDEKSEK